jgi:hypothetical protein
MSIWATPTRKSAGAANIERRTSEENIVDISRRRD